MKYFAGSYTHKVDAKGRVSLPVAYRNTLKKQGSEQVVLVPQYYSGDYHVGLSEAQHEAAVEKIEMDEAMPLEKRRAMLRRLVAEAHLLTPDDAGRIVLPRELRQQLGLKGEVLFTALGPYFEVWDPATYEAKTQGTDDDATASLMGGGVQ